MKNFVVIVDRESEYPGAEDTHQVQAVRFLTDDAQSAREDCEHILEREEIGGDVVMVLPEELIESGTVLIDTDSPIRDMDDVFPGLRQARKFMR